MMKFVIGWIGIGFCTWLFILFIALVTVLLSRHSKDIRTKIVYVKAELLMNELMRPECVIFSAIRGPILALKLIMITLEAIFSK